MATNYFSGQGIVELAKWNGDVKGDYRDIGNVPSLKVSTSVSKKDHKESRTGQRAIDKKIITEKKVTIAFEAEDITSDNLAMAFQGAITKTSTATAVTATSPALTKGQVWQLPNVNVSNVVITDNASQPLVAGTDYIVNEKYGTVTYISTSQTLTMPLKATFNVGASTKIAFMTEAQGEYALRFHGLNTAEDNKPVIIEIEKISLDPAKDFDFITDDFAKLAFEGEVLMTNGKTVEVTLVDA